MNSVAYTVHVDSVAYTVHVDSVASYVVPVGPVPVQSLKCIKPGPTQ